MDERYFDHLARALSEASPRRGLLGLLATLPVLGGLVALLDQDEVDAKGRRKRRKKRHKHGKGRDKGKHKKRPCKPHAKTRTCDGRCGPVKNNCKKTVDCGSCNCPEPCQDCSTCQSGPNTPGTCVPDPDKLGDPCGVASCTDGVATPASICVAGGLCQPGEPIVCAPYHCNGDQCATTCANDDDCAEGYFCDGDGHCAPVLPAGDPCEADGQCASGFCVTGVCCTTACDGVCQVCDASGDGACTTAQDGATCGDEAICCSGDCVDGVCCASADCQNAGAPQCVDHDCACAANSNEPCADGLTCCDTIGCVNTDTSRQNCGACGRACGTDQLCVDGSCLDCTVTCDEANHSCQSFDLQDAIDEGGTVVVCPGRYGPLTLRIAEANVTIIGAGQGDDPSVDTILLGDLRVFFNDVNTTMRHMLLAGGRRPSAFGGAGFTNFAGGTVILEDCTIAQNQTVTEEKAHACGAINNQGRLEMTRCTVRDNSISNPHAEGTSAGAGICNFGQLVMTDCLIHDNTAEAGKEAMGGGLYMSGGTVELTRCRITGNTLTAPATGAGGIHNVSGTSLELTDSFVWDNTAPDCAGGITVVGSGGCGAEPLS